MHRSLAADGVPALLGPSRLGMTPTTEVEAAATSGELRHMERSTKTWSIVFAFGRQRAARSAKEYEAHVLVGAPVRLGPAISSMIPITGEVVAVIHLEDRVTTSQAEAHPSVSCMLQGNRGKLSVSAKPPNLQRMECTGKQNSCLDLTFP